MRGHINTHTRPGDNVPSGLLCAVELMIAIICASLPTYRPLSRKIFKKDLMTTKASYGRNYASGTQSRHVNVSGGPAMEMGSGIRVTEYIKMVSHVRREDGWYRMRDDDEESRMDFKDGFQG